MVDRGEAVAHRRPRLSMKRIGSDIAVLLLRAALALIFIPHGWSKVMGAGGVGAFVQDLPSYGIPAFLGYIPPCSPPPGPRPPPPHPLTRSSALSPRLPH